MGKRLIRRLVAERHEVSALTRSGSSTSSLLEQMGARVIRGTLENIDEWETRLEGHDVVIHLAAPPEFWGRRGSHPTTGLRVPPRTYSSAPPG